MAMFTAFSSKASRRLPADVGNFSRAHAGQPNAGRSVMIGETFRAALCLPPYIFIAMKTALILTLALAALAPVQAQIFRSPSFGGVATGAIIGRNSGSLGHNAWRGAGYVAAAGLLFDGAFGPRYGYGYYDSRGRSAHRHFAPHMYVYRPASVVCSGVYDYNYNYDYAFEGRRDYRGSGLWLGTLAGAIIGHNSGSLGHNAWRGAAYGAGAGYLLGAIAESDARRREAIVERAAPVMAATAAQPQQVTIINNYYNAPATPMSSANGLFGR